MNKVAIKRWNVLTYASHGFCCACNYKLRNMKERVTRELIFFYIRVEFNRIVDKTKVQTNEPQPNRMQAQIRKCHLFDILSCNDFKL